MTASKSWLGVNLSFDGVDDSTSKSSGFELLKCGFYPAIIKSLEVKKTDTNACLEVVFELDDNKKEVKGNYWLPKKGDKPESIDIKKRNLKNLFTRAMFSEITEAEYKAMDKAEVDKQVNELLAQDPKVLVGKKVAVKVQQSPFVSKDRETKAIKFLEINKASVVQGMPDSILKAIQYLETKAGVQYEKMPMISFSNDVGMNGIDFYLDYNADKDKKYDSKAYEWYQTIKGGNTAPSSSAKSDLVDEDEIPF